VSRPFRLVGLLVLSLVLPVVATPMMHADARAPGSLSAELSASWQADATVWQMAYGAGRVWMIGDFTDLRPPDDPAGVGDVPSPYLAELNAATGAPDADIDTAHLFEGQPSGLTPLTRGAVALSPDGTTVYVGGNFTSVDGQEREHIAAFSASTGALLPWSPYVQGAVRSIATYGDVVYLGGDFGSVDHAPARFLAAVSSLDGAVVQWGPSQPYTNNAVAALAVSTDGSQVVVGGYFDEVDGLTGSADGLTSYNGAAVIGGIGTPSAGQLEPLAADQHAVPRRSVNCVSVVKDVVISGGVAYFANEGTGEGCFDGTWAADLATGSLAWVNRCLGATQTLAVVGDYLYKGSHIHDCRSTNPNGDPDNFPEVPKNENRHLTSESLATGYLGPWYPDAHAGPNLGPRTMVTDGTQLFVGGDFTKVDGTLQQGIARFTPTSDYPTPRPAAPSVTKDRSGRITVRAVPPVDLDDPDLILELFRGGSNEPIAETPVHSLFWRQPVVSWVDDDVPSGARPHYRVQAVAAAEEQASPMSAPASPRDTCASARQVPAALEHVAAKRVSRLQRRVRVQVCIDRAVRMTVVAKRADHTIDRREITYTQPGRHAVKLLLLNNIEPGRVRIHVVFRRHARRKSVTRGIYLPH
jgi:hypothetical protein